MSKPVRSLSIRPAAETDVPAILGLYRHLVPDDPTIDLVRATEIFRRFAAIEGSTIWLGERNGEAIASCVLVVVPNLTRGGAPYALIENVVTHADHRRQGHGRALLDAACESAWAHGCYKVMLLTGAKSPGTLDFYSDIGFTQTKTGFERRRIPPRANA